MNDMPKGTDSPSPIVTLTTDFGTRDGYVAAMKGVILGICPRAVIVDISHEIPPQSIAEGAYTLATACRWFPKSAVHLCVVDPGVGTSRRALAVQTPSGRFVAPDNGVLTHVLDDIGVSVVTDDADSTGASPISGIQAGFAAFELNDPSWWLPEISNTFHGRDIFAPTAAHLANGVRPAQMGVPISSVARLPSQPVSGENPVTGCVVHVDTYGNLISNIPGSAIPHGGDLRITVAGRTIRGMSRAYGDGLGSLLAIVGSQGTVEVAVCMGSAHTALGVGVGESIEITSGDSYG